MKINNNMILHNCPAPSNQAMYKTLLEMARKAPKKNIYFRYISKKVYYTENLGAGVIPATINDAKYRDKARIGSNEHYLIPQPIKVMKDINGTTARKSAVNHKIPKIDKELTSVGYAKTYTMSIMDSRGNIIRTEKRTSNRINLFELIDAE